VKAAAAADAADECEEIFGVVGRCDEVFYYRFRVLIVPHHYLQLHYDANTSV
jgi:hypothetical protein